MKSATEFWSSSNWVIFHFGCPFLSSSIMVVHPYTPLAEFFKFTPLIWSLLTQNNVKIYDFKMMIFPSKQRIKDVFYKFCHACHCNNISSLLLAIHTKNFVKLSLIAPLIFYPVKLSSSKLSI